MLSFGGKRGAWTPRALALCCALILGADAHAGLEYKWKDVKEIHFGNGLFNLYQDRNFTGAIQLAADIDMHKLKSQTEEAELALVMLELDYGMHRRAASHMAQLESKGEIQEDFKNHVWFLTAKQRYQRGYTNQAESALANITGALPLELEQQQKAFTALLLMDREQYTPASKVLANVGGKIGPIPALARYNNGVSTWKAKEKDKAIALLEQIGTMNADSEELKNIRDRANRDLGYIYLFDEKPDLSIERFERVRLEGVSSNDALLGLGWNYYNKATKAEAAGNKLDFAKHCERALVAWAELSQRNVGDTTVQEARVAAPYVLARLEAYGQAGEQYDFALTSFKKELVVLDNLINAIKQGNYFERLILANREGEKGWNGDVENLALTEDAYYFTQMLADHVFQEAFKNYRDLRYLQSKLDEWESDISVFGTSSSRWLSDIQVRAAQFSRVNEADKIKQLRDRRDLALRELGDVEKARAAAALASDQEREWLQVIGDLEQRAAKEPDAGRAAAYANRLRYLRGRVQWDVYAKFSNRVATIKARIKEIDTAINDAVAAQDHLVNAAKGAEYFQKSFEPRFTNANLKIKQMRPGVSAAIQGLEDYLKVLVLKDLEKRKQNLGTFLSQVAYSVGQSFDPGAKK